MVSEMDKKKPVFEPAYADRGTERTPISGKSRLTKQNWYSVEVMLCDLSSRGFMVECAENVSIGSYVTLDVPGIGPVRAQVRWQLGARMGGMFLDPIHTAHCEWTASKVPDESKPAAE
jgi:hypothetical protein